MLTREQILEIDMYCAEHKVTQESRLDELNIPRHQFYRWKKRYRESDEAGQTPEGGSFLQLTPGGSFVSPMMPPSRTSGKTKGGPGPAVAESFLTIELRTVSGSAMRILSPDEPCPRCQVFTTALTLLTSPRGLVRQAAEDA